MAAARENGDASFEAARQDGARRSFRVSPHRLARAATSFVALSRNALPGNWTNKDDCPTISSTQDVADFNVADFVKLLESADGNAVKLRRKKAAQALLFADTWKKADILREVKKFVGTVYEDAISAIHKRDDVFEMSPPTDGESVKCLEDVAEVLRMIYAAEDGGIVADEIEELEAYREAVEQSLVREFPLLVAASNFRLLPNRLFARLVADFLKQHRRGGGNQESDAPRWRDWNAAMASLLRKPYDRKLKDLARKFKQLADDEISDAAWMQYPRAGQCLYIVRHGRDIHALLQLMMARLRKLDQQLSHSNGQDGQPEMGPRGGEMGTLASPGGQRVSSTRRNLLRKIISFLRHVSTYTLSRVQNDTPEEILNKCLFDLALVLKYSSSLQQRTDQRDLQRKLQSLELESLSALSKELPRVMRTPAYRIFPKKKFLNKALELYEKNVTRVNGIRCWDECTQAMSCLSSGLSRERERECLELLKDRICAVLLDHLPDLLREIEIEFIPKSGEDWGFVFSVMREVVSRLKPQICTDVYMEIKYMVQPDVLTDSAHLILLQRPQAAVEWRDGDHISQHVASEEAYEEFDDLRRPMMDVVLAYCRQHFRKVSRSGSYRNLSKDEKRMFQDDVYR